MSIPILATKIYIPPPRPKVVFRARLIERLNEGLYRKLTLISAPAGFGKSTLVSEWLASCEQPAAWLSLDERDNDLTRFLAYLVAALQTLVLPPPRTAKGIKAEGIAGNTIGEGVLNLLQSPQPPITISALISKTTIKMTRFIRLPPVYV